MLNKAVAESRAEGRAEGKAEGKTEGIAEGAAAERQRRDRELILKSHQQGWAPEQISQFFDLELELVESVLNSQT